MTEVIEYRLSWEMPPPIEVDAIEQHYGKNVWPNFDWNLFSKWSTTTVTWLDGETPDRIDQYETLKQWAETREQPIRNVTLERREVPDPAEGWEEL